MQAHAQKTTTELSFSEPIKASKYALILNSGEINDKIYTIMSDKNEYFMLIYDENLKFLKRTSFKKKNCKEDDCIDSHFSYKRTLFFNDRILVLFETYEKSTKNHQLLCQAFDLNGNFFGDLTIIDQIQATSKSKFGSFYIEYSKDKTKFVVIQNTPFDKKEDEKFNFKVYDASLKNLSNASIELPYKDKNVSVINYYLSNKGDIYILVSVKLENNQKDRKEDEKFYSLLCLNTSSDNSLTDHRIQLPQKVIKSVSLQIDDDNEQIACAGLYSDIQTSAKRTNDIDGVFYLNIDMKTNQQLSQSYKPLDKAMVARLLGKKEGTEVKETKGIPVTFNISDFAKLPDGSAYIIAESNWVKVTQSCGKYGCTYIYTYYYYNLLAINISPEGEIRSLIDIPKRQISSSSRTDFFSYRMMQKDDKIFLLFNDHPKNVLADINSIKDVKIIKSEVKSSLVMVELLPNGNYTKTELFLNKNRKAYPKPTRGFEIENGKYVFPLKNASGSFGFFRIDLK
jgi:hypothetical protein